MRPVRGYRGPMLALRSSLVAPARRCIQRTQRRREEPLSESASTDTIAVGATWRRFSGCGQKVGLAEDGGPEGPIQITWPYHANRESDGPCPLKPSSGRPVFLAINRPSTFGRSIRYANSIGPTKGCARTRKLEIFGLQSGMPGNPGQDPAAQFGIIVKRELVVGPSFAGEQFVGSALAFHAPADAPQGSQHAAGFSRRPVAHSVPGRTR